MNRVALKEDAKSILNTHFSFYFLLFLPYFILEIISGYLVGLNESSDLAPTDGVGSLIAWAAYVVMVGLSFVCLDAMREKLTYEQPMQKSLFVFNNGDYFIGAVLISILKYIFITLWTFLLIVPGIIKMMAYSQTFYIYRDAIDNGEHIGYTEAITRSRQMMDGHKAEYFVLQLSFIGWYLLIVVTLGLAAIWVQPYISLSLANYYNELSLQQAGTAETNAS
ncbi:DUF975 family protein [Lentilactobacillus farraginis]|uniref:Integral membrane protein n=1 Tax=Lentilactobacillus farraginis DSM 18382 = JCM 14108 TaxID=1423743 RepID=X0PHW2_9LACO|nr:DUF975 family protein [Lentilactobacillus farraginis]KRM11461.1 integral membrane protein [Lentilactobacillus farraginis DSM 18382 = JCM 14108]GAF36066.1 hypothetical protein JCM14108_1008 [Lentilactobacillus farraginis DSM 18382 = JCM 14108]